MNKRLPATVSQKKCYFQNICNRIVSLPMSHWHRDYRPNLAKSFAVAPLKIAGKGHTSVNLSVKPVTVPTEEFVVIIKFSTHVDL